jgi:hypothetical protein
MSATTSATKLAGIRFHLGAAWCRVTAYFGTRSPVRYQSHNAGVVGSSPTPAITYGFSWKVRDHRRDHENPFFMSAGR